MDGLRTIFLVLAAFFSLILTPKSKGAELAPFFTLNLKSMGVPQIVWIVLMAVGLLFSAYSHGKLKTRKQSFWLSLIAVAISFSILFWGGFFTNNCN